MKTINELTEKEILNLSDAEVQKMIKLRLAEEGIKIMDLPKKPELFEIAQPDTIVYQITALGESISFSDINEANSVLDLLLKCSSIGLVNYDYNKLGSDYKYFEKGKTMRYSSSNGLEMKSVSAYSMKLYAEITDLAVQNKKMQNQVEKEIKEYDEINAQCSDIIFEITEKVSYVKDKYDRLNTLIFKLKNDYLPLADNNQEIAMNFLKKAYSITDEEDIYIISNI